MEYRVLWAAAGRLARPRQTADQEWSALPTRRSREVLAVGGWRLGKAERRRMRCHRIPTWLDRRAGVRQFLGRVLKNANTLSMSVQLTLIPGSFSRF